MLVINAFNGLGAESVIDFARNGVDVNFAAEGITAISFHAGGKLVPCTYSGNTVRFQAGKLGLRPGIYIAKLVAVSAAVPDGEAIAGPGEEIEIELKYHS
jgi:hypothetical protein